MLPRPLNNYGDFNESFSLLRVEVCTFDDECVDKCQSKHSYVLLKLWPYLNGNI